MLLQQNFDLPLYITKFIRHLTRQNYSQETITGYGKDLKKFSEFLFKHYSGSLLTEEIEKEDIKDFISMLDASGLKPNSVARHLSSIKSFYNFLVYEMNFPVNVGAQVKQSKLFTPLPTILTPVEIQQFLEAAKQYSMYYHVLFSLLYYTGSRLTPVITLRKKDVDMTINKVYFPKTKNGRDLHLPLHDKLSKLLDDYLYLQKSIGSEYVFPSPRSKFKPISAADVRKKMYLIKKIAGISKRMTPHLLRHCMATHLTILGVDQKYVASILGHVDLRATARYQQLNVDNLRPSINKI